MAIEQITAPEAEHGEGPVWGTWAPGDTGLRYVDMLRGDVLALDGAGGTVSRKDLGSVAAAIRPRLGGGMVAALEREFALISPQGTVQPLGDVWSDTAIRFNEGGTDPLGRFYCGSMAYDQTQGAGTMFRLDPDGLITTVWGDVTISNGLAWSPDESTVYYVDTPTQQIVAFEYAPDTGIVLDSRRTVVEIDKDLGGPDGLAVDAEGGLWVALFGGSAVHRYTADGALDQEVAMPVSQITACTFGGPNLDELYITTSRHGLGDGAEPAAGALFRTEPGVAGIPVVPFAG